MNLSLRDGLARRITDRRARGPGGGEASVRAHLDKEGGPPGQCRIGDGESAALNTGAEVHGISDSERVPVGAQARRSGGEGSDAVGALLGCRRDPECTARRRRILADPGPEGVDGAETRAPSRAGMVVTTIAKATGIPMADEEQPAPSAHKSSAPGRGDDVGPAELGGDGLDSWLGSFERARFACRPWPDRAGTGGFPRVTGQCASDG